MSRKIEDGLTRTQRYRLKDVDAYRKKKREYARTPKEREKRNEYMRQWKFKNPERTLELARKSYHRNKEKISIRVKSAYYKKRYNLTVEEVNKMKEGGCQFCGSRENLHIDHSHETEKVRGVLCMRCNTHLGWLETIGIEKVHEYIKIGEINE